MSEIYYPSEFASQRAWIKSMDQYKEMYERSIQDSEGFWNEEAQNFVWFNKWDKVRDFNYNI